MIRQSLLTALFIASALQPAYSQSSASDAAINVSIGIRGFSNRVTGPGYSDTKVPGTAPLEVPISSERALSFLPSVSIRYGDYGINGTYHVSTDYRANIPAGGGENHFNRKEWDLSLSYSLLPNVLLAAGWKSIDIAVKDNGFSPFSQTIEAPFLGLSLAGALTEHWSFYANLTIGRPALKVDGATTGDRGEYFASEVGLRYSLAQLSPSLKNTSALLGYRAQNFRFDNVPFSYFGVTSTGLGLLNGTHSISAGIEGLTFGIAVSY